MKIGVIKYRKYEERVLLNQHFLVDDLFRIILEDKDFVWFNIIDEHEKVVLSTWYPDTKNGAQFIQVLKISKEVEILGTTYDAYKSPPFKYRTKTTWKAGIDGFKTKKGAKAYAEKNNNKVRHAIEMHLSQEN